MTIHQEDGEIRVERVEQTARTMAGGCLVTFAIGAGYIAALADSLGDWLMAGGLMLMGAWLARINLRRRHVCIIQPDRIGYGFLGGRLWWVERHRIGIVRVYQSFLLEVRFLDPDGRLFASHVFSNFDRKELRQALEMAGVPVEANR
jgi:hypothetical protein